MMAYYKELYHDARHDELVVLHNNRQVCIGLRKMIVLLQTDVFVEFSTKVQNLCVDFNVESPLQTVGIEFPGGALKLLFNKTEFARFGKMLKKSTATMLQPFAPGEEQAGNHQTKFPQKSIRYYKKQKQLIQKAVSIIKARGFKKNYTIISLAKEIGTNETTLKHAFKEVMQTTIYKFYQERRMTVALTRLKAGDPVTKVAEDIGFSTVGHFSYAFKKYFGNCPSDYSKVF